MIANGDQSIGMEGNSAIVVGNGCGSHRNSAGIEYGVEWVNQGIAT